MASFVRDLLMLLAMLSVEGQLTWCGLILPLSVHIGLDVPLSVVQQWLTISVLYSVLL